MSKQVLILGSQGHFGAAAAAAFSQAGWRVLCHARRPDAVLPAGARYLPLDTLQRQQAIAAMREVLDSYTRHREEKSRKGRH